MTTHRENAVFTGHSQDEHTIHGSAISVIHWEPTEAVPPQQARRTWNVEETHIHHSSSSFTTCTAFPFHAILLCQSALDLRD